MKTRKQKDFQEKMNVCKPKTDTASGTQELHKRTELKSWSKLRQNYFLPFFSFFLDFLLLTFSFFSSVELDVKEESSLEENLSLDLVEDK